jgi:hypothetical protein
MQVWIAFGMYPRRWFALLCFCPLGWLAGPTVGPPGTSQMATIHQGHEFLVA